MFFSNKLQAKKGQLLLEVLFAIAVSAAVLGVGASILIGGLNAAKVSTERDAALQLVDETFEAVRAIAFEDWNGVYGKNKGSSELYYPELDVDSGELYKWESHSGGWGSAYVSAVSALSPHNVWIIASNDVYQYDGATWTNRNVFNQFVANDIVTVSDEEIWAVGQGGNVWEFNGSTLTQHSGTGLWETTDINGVSASNSSNVWIVGDSGIVYKYDGSTWTSHSGGWGSTQLNAASALSNNVYIVGESDEVWQYDGSSWIDRSPSALSAIGINDVSFDSASDPVNVWIAGDSGNVWQYDGSWREHDSGNRWGAANVSSVSAYDTDHVFVAAGQKLWVYTGGITWTEFTSGWTADILAISDRFSTELWVAGNSGLVREFKPAKWMLTAVSGQNNEITLNGVTYDIEVYIQNICRDAGSITGITDSNGVDTDPTACDDNGGSEDISTQKVTIKVTWAGNEIEEVEYITRWMNDSCLQTQWSNTGNTDVHLICPTTDFTSSTNMNFLSSDTSLAILTPLLNANATLISTVFDTVRSDTPDASPIYRFIRWNGNMEDSADVVRFQIASSDTPNPATWEYYGGSSCTSGGWFSWSATTGAITNEQAEINCPNLNNKRYFKYKVELLRGELIPLVSGTTPRVDDVNIIWTP